MTNSALVNEVVQERQRQVALAHGGNTQAFDKLNSRNDWVSYITAYAGRAADKVRRNDRQGEDFRTNMVKVAALALAALEAYDAGWC